MPHVKHDLEQVAREVYSMMADRREALGDWKDAIDFGGDVNGWTRKKFAEGPMIEDLNFLAL